MSMDKLFFGCKFFWSPIQIVDEMDFIEIELL